MTQRNLIEISSVASQHWIYNVEQNATAAACNISDHHSFFFKTATGIKKFDMLDTSSILIMTSDNTNYII